MGTVAHRILDDLLFVDIHTDARTLNRVEVAAFCLVVAGEHCLDLVFQLDVLLNGGIMQMDVQVGIHRHPDGGNVRWGVPCDTHTKGFAEVRQLYRRGNATQLGNMACLLYTSRCV